jgi:TonB-dependent SusC/RagA subfamily outer membrane receptor
VNAAGIAISSPDRTPLEGVIVRDRVTGLQTTTDVNGYCKLQIPFNGDPGRVDLDYIKAGYDSDYRQRHFPLLKETVGMLDIAVLRQLNDHRRGSLIGWPSSYRVPVDPDYADAENELHRVLKENDDLMRYMQLQKDHPEVSLFYETEDRQKEIIVHTDGTIERYGYPGTPALDEMVKKYGDMQGYMATSRPEGHLVNSGYLARWAAIGEQARQEFHTTNPNVRAIIFPGDSRVIVVPVSGKVRFYDMDNDAGNERAEFERLYGKLPDVVPNAGFNSDEMERGTRLAAPPAARGVRDTAPGKRKDTANMIIRLRREDTVEPLYVIDGVIVPRDSLKTLHTDQIASIRVLKDSAADKKYGEKGKNGVIQIYMKGMKGINAMPKGVLYFVDGREMARDSVMQLNTDDIESVHVLKGEQARAMYGEKGKDGVILITLKHPSGLGTVPGGGGATPSRPAAVRVDG